jgi:hypothetical protein
MALIYLQSFFFQTESCSNQRVNYIELKSSRLELGLRLSRGFSRSNNLRC